MGFSTLFVSTLLSLIINVILSITTTNQLDILCVLYKKISLVDLTAGIFEDDTVAHVEETVDPIRDMEIISNEV
jgi:hypothetical protein